MEIFTSGDKKLELPSNEELRASDHPPGRGFEYWGFISYAGEDEEFAEWLHRSLERYRIPRRLIGRRTPTGTVPRRLYPIYRDKDEISASSDLGLTIRTALHQSHSLFVVCSPKAVESEWVNEEIRTFKEAGGESRIFGLIVGGEPEGAGGGIEPGCFPPTMRFRVASDGQVDQARTAEPIAADIRDGHDSRANAKLRLIAGAIGVSFDELKQRERHRQRLRVAGWSFASVFLLIAFFTIWGWQQRRVMEAQRYAESRSLASTATSHLGDRPDLALLLSLEAGRIADSVESKRSLLRALQRIPQDTIFLWGHKDFVSNAIFSPDGKTILSAGWDNLIVLYDVATHRAIGQPITAAEGANSVAFSPDGSRFASSGPGSVTIWDTASQKRIGEPFKLADQDSYAHQDFYHVAFSSTGKLLAASTDANGERPSRIFIWDFASHHLLAPSIEGSTFAFSPNDLLLAIGQYEKLVLFDLRTHRRIGKPLEGHTKNISTLAFSPDGTVIASGSYDKTIMLWDVKTRRPINSLTGQSGAITCILFDTSGQALFSGDDDGNIIRWQGFSNMGNIVFWDSDTVKPSETSVKNLHAPISAIFVSRAGRRMSLALPKAQAAGQLLLTDSRDDPPLGRRVSAPDANNSNLAFSPDGHRLASVGDFYDVEEWDVARRVPIGEPLSGHERHVASLAYSPDGKTLVSGDDSGRIIFWSANAHKPIGPPVQHRQSPVWSLAWSIDGKTVVSGEDGGIVFWDAAKRELLEYRTMPDRIWSLAFSPDGKFLVSDGNSLVATIWKVGTGPQPFKTFGAPRPKDNSWELTPTGLSFSPNGVLLATSSLGKSITIRDFESGQPIPPLLEGHLGSVSSLAFSRDGKVLASASDESEIRLWDVDTHELIGALLDLPEDNTVRSVVFSPTSEILASSIQASNGGEDAIIFWDVNYKVWWASACATVNRNLTESEWNTYMGNHPYRRTCQNN